MKVIAKLVVIVNEYFHPANKQVLYDRLLLLDLYVLLVVTILAYVYAKDDLDEVIFFGTLSVFTFYSTSTQVVKEFCFKRG